MTSNIAVIGAGGALGNALIQELSASYPAATVHGFSRTPTPQHNNNIYYHAIRYGDEQSIKTAADIATQNRPLDIVLVTTGFLHDDNIKPEKSLSDLSTEKFEQLFAINTILPALLAKHFIPKLNKNHHSIFACLSARVGSISDNRLGGWYAYRASKAALNMIIKTAAIETARYNPMAIIAGLHPGTVNSNLSQPFQRNVPDNKLFSPQFSAQKLVSVLSSLTPEQSGLCFAWDGQEIMP